MAQRKGNETRVQSWVRVREGGGGRGEVSGLQAVPSEHAQRVVPEKERSPRSQFQSSPASLCRPCSQTTVPDQACWPEDTMPSWLRCVLSVNQTDTHTRTQPLLEEPVCPKYMEPGFLPRAMPATLGHVMGMERDVWGGGGPWASGHKGT